MSNKHGIEYKGFTVWVEEHPWNESDKFVTTIVAGWQVEEEKRKGWKAWFDEIQGGPITSKESSVDAREKAKALIDKFLEE